MSIIKVGVVDTLGKTPSVFCFAEIALLAEQIHSLFSGEKQVHSIANYESLTAGKVNVVHITIQGYTLKSNMPKSTKEFQ